eukprot:CAMPEP_0194172024 /NCGR_PEP_ID=MMETSP0154-20130528/6555_1 /TAXON_ID=1049557 /ORGANISM="Thalassiothrix antarctica, Strain L6-D1" /LENGTH=207 /DNA_ID=CAMNT_0038884559 /DNA_START=25 /DNA_END=648 /DNA_ORIENTATION=-
MTIPLLSFITFLFFLNDKIFCLANYADIDPSYDDLLKCMWNGTTVAMCHQVEVDTGCVWCHSAHSNICVTKEYANNLDGSVFRCENHHDTDPPSPSPTQNDDQVNPIDDDDAPAHHDSNKDYFDHLLQCMDGYNDSKDCNEANLSFKCQWCWFAPQQGICFSKQAANQAMNGEYYNCTSSESTNIVNPEIVEKNEKTGSTMPSRAFK